MSEVHDFEGVKVRKYLDKEVNSFLLRPPISDYERGWMAATVVLYKECLGNMDDERLRKVEDMVGPLPCRHETIADYMGDEELPDDCS